MRERKPPAVLDATAIAALASALPAQSPSPERRAALRARVLEAIRVPIASAAGIVVTAEEGQWLPFIPGIAIKFLRVDRQQRTQTSLWRLQAGAVIPEHDHVADAEECLILEGTMLMHGRRYGTGDFLLAPAGLHHDVFVSPTGALLMIRSELTAPLDQLAVRAQL
jgi:anti-sigma factor ChrR (cupin superfamily)